MHPKTFSLFLGAALTLWFAGGASAQNLTVSEDFTGTSASQNWTAYDGACLTAGDGSGKIPSCASLTAAAKYYRNITLNGGQTGSLPDQAGFGALRFTNNTNYQTGAILSNFTFPSGSGIAITFSTVTYAGTGADGIGFFLLDGSVSPNGVGGSGGSLGYSCSNTNAKNEGLAGAYMGLGMDEFGNFLNASDNTSTGAGFKAGRIGLRGAGNITWAALLAAKRDYYNVSGLASSTAVGQVCKTGYHWDYRSSLSRPTQKEAITYNYNMIDGSAVNLPSTTPLYTKATTRPAAKPVTYQLKITNDNLLSLSYSYNGGTYQQVLKDQSIADTNGPLPNTLKFGFSGSTGGSNNIHEVMCFRAAPATRSSSSASTNIQQGTEVRTGTQVYLAGYNPNNWSGQFTSQNLVVTAANEVAVASNANWDASCVLTGGNCLTMGGTASSPVNVTVQAPAARTLLTWSGTGGIPFQYDSLSTAQKAVINAGDSNSNANRVNYLRGDRSNEGSTNTKFRTRDSVLGDIIDSGPALAGVPSSPYGGTWVDNTRTGATHAENAASAQKYAAFVTANKTRLNVVYTGANDGFVHGFRTGAYNAAGDYVNSTAYPNDGKEVLAYMPSTVFGTIHNNTTASLDYANRLYSHDYDVNAVPAVGDLFYANAWHTWLVGGLGAGGAGIYALDVTDPTRFAESNAASLVKADWSTGNLPCSIGLVAQACGDYLGATYGQPQIRRFHNGSWGYVFGNGRDSTNGKAGIFVVLVSPTDGSQTAYFISTGNGTAAARNGITYVTPADLDGDHITDYVYGGDVNGNVWRFDLTSATPAAWATSQFGTLLPTPLIATGLPVTTKPIVAIVPAKSGNPRVIVTVGTGYKTSQNATSAAAFTTTASGTNHRFYGVWDWDMGTWNTVTRAWSVGSWNSKTVSGGLRSGLAGTKTIAASDLQAQTITNLSDTQRTITSNGVCWQGATDCTTANNKYGWYINLPATTEQVIYNPVLYNGMLLLTSTIPAASNVLNCNDDTTDSGYLMTVAPATGGGFSQSAYADASGNFTNVTVNGVSYPVAGVATKGVGSPSVVTVKPATSTVGLATRGGTYVVFGTTTSSGDVRKQNELGANNGSRVTWQQVR